MQKFYTVFLAVTALFTANLPGTFAQPVIGYQTITTGLSNPVDVVNNGGTDLYIVQQGGIIRRWNGSSLSDFINISSVLTSAGNEQGLLSLAFHPSYATNGYFFVWYTNTTGDITLARYRRSTTDPLIGDPLTGQVLLSLPKPGGFTNHNGAKIIFGTDGMLYIGTGDGGSGGDPNNLAQNGASLFGKMLRIDVNSFATSAPFYNIPPDNPFLVPGDGIADEIYNTGLRNPWRWSFDRQTGDMWIADVGQGLYEEVNHVAAGSTAGVNYGWRCREGQHPYNGTGCTSGYTDPVFEYGHNGTTGGFSITGGYVYRGTEFPVFNGWYICTDYVSSNLWLYKPGTGLVRQGGVLNNISGFGENADGTVLYAVRRSTGVLYKVIVTGTVPVNISNFNVVRNNGFNEVSWHVGTEVNTARYVVEYSTDSNVFLAAGQVAATGAAAYSFEHGVQNRGVLFYRIRIVDNDGNIKLSPVVRLNALIDAVKIYPTVVSSGVVTVELPAKGMMLQLYDAAGKNVFNKDLRNIEGIYQATLPALSKGLYLMRISGSGYDVKTKLILQ
ncbi:MAG: PQQ-dependent sugar dehydrogenase [Ferruginibacter sp.]